MIVKGETIVLTNKEYFTKYCFKSDLCRINRMWEKHLDKTIGRDATMADKELEYDRWLHKDFSQADWDAATTRTTNTRDIWW